ncbi:DUF748 domain-containing protein [Paracidovorax citrulli]|uniref:DUF748 domain-containing protein n=2 Tax=Paracidovorax citrulli TaxID=80869 RepID=A1TRG9_PARC0|nr:DUF748 domain-containing protein [Paracidovorax citrulli]ABM33557.1 protein of unknown function DUF748 [Paracidovorax citrulli AAC00-1]ATG94169.1 DUF748 domain-containing protein [Paracidovorax citrulli]PVY62984.1 uncharacterized protein DUF748 [Paracidovorax citrulli]QCX12717.1 hypothetical protein APS58_4008 [Paracidovorax citrulli]REG68033.1 uncharacterized protein DUF748 [Paracidovorax citrulli]
MGAIESSGERAQDPVVGGRHVRQAAAVIATRWAAAGIALLLLVWGLAWLAVPPLVRWGLERWGSSFAGRAVTVGKVDFRPWTLELTVHDIALAAAAPGAPAQAEIRRLYIDMEVQSLVRWAPVLDALEIDAPRLRVVRGQDGRYDIHDLLQRGAARPGSGGGGGARFALYNLALRDGAVEFADRTTGQTHRLTGLELGIPFLSNLPADRQVTVTPRLAFSLDGSTFDTGARSTPFSEDRNTQARLRIRGLDLSPLRAYWPAGTPLRPQAGTLEAELDIGFLQGPQPRLTVGGHARLSGVRLDGPPGSGPVAFQALDIHAASVEPLRKSAHLVSVEWSGPDIAVRRDARGRWDWAAAAGGAGSARGAPAATPPAGGAGPSSGAWQVAIDRFAVREGHVAWRDESAARTVAMAWDGVHAQAQSLSWPWKGGIPFRLQARMRPAAAGAAQAPATLRVAGTAWPGRGQVAASLRGLPLSAVEAYAAGAFAPQVGARIEADAGVAWNHANGALVVKVARFAADGVTLACPAGGPCAAPSADAGRSPEGTGTPPGAWGQAERLEIENAWIDVPARTVSVERAVARAPRLRAERDAQGRWMFDAWPRGTAERVPSQEVRAAGGEVPWSVRLAEVSVERGAVALRDAVPSSPVDLRWSAIALQARGLRWPQAAAGPAAPVQLSLSGQWEAGRREPGRLAYEGRLTMAPLAVQGRLQAQRLPLHLLEPYAAPWLNVRIVRAEAGFEGDVDYAATAAGAKATVRGNAALDEVRVRAPAPAPAPETGAGTPSAQPRGEELLRWRNLALQGVQWETAPGAPARLDVRETALRDFFARIVLQKNGRLNLQDLVRSPDASSRREPVPAPAQAAASDAAAVRPAAAPTAAAAHAGPLLRFGPVVLSAGAVRFTDYFIEPNYSADLGDLAGRIGAFSSEPAPGGGEPAMAELELSGKAQGSAPLEISGRINPLAKPLALDIQGRVRDLELPPLSPYAVKYAGHGIERGKLSMDVRYKVQPDGQLTAGNRLVLHQLTFSDPVEGAPASLPVRLAAALLADSNGVIDLDLPISGSLNDPQFSLGPVILRAVGSLVLKAVTSPFSLLAKAFAGGTAEQGAVAFAPGSAVLDAAALQGLDKVAQSLRDRPALQLTVTGHAVAEAEEDGWKRERLRSQVQALQQRRQPAVRADAGVQGVEGMQGTPVAPGVPDAARAQAYADALRELYRRADIPKPRNLLGMARDIPVPEMEALLLAQTKVPDGALGELAQARAVAVRDELARRGVPLERLFVAAPRVDARGEGAAPQAQLALSAR